MLLTAIIVVPAIGAAVIALIPRDQEAAIKGVAALASGVTAVLALWALGVFDRGDAGFQMVTDHAWVKSFGISWKLGIDGISLFLVVLTGILFPIAIFGPSVHHDFKGYATWMLVLEAGCLGVFCALDLFLFFVFWEIVLVPMYFLIGGWGYERRVYAALKFFLYTMLGSALMLVGILTLVFLHRAATGELTFDLVRLAESQSIAHSTEAPTGGSVILAAVLLKLGTYGFLRFGLYLFPQAAVDLAPLFLTLGVIGILYGAIVAAMQRDLKRLVAYSSVAHLGFIVVGTFALSTQGLQGGVLQMVNHGLSTGALFLLVGMIYERRHTRLIADFGGLQKVAPLFAAVFTVVMLSSIGLPGLNGFVGEFLVLIGTFVTRRWWAVPATAGVILAAVYLLWAYQRVFHGVPSGENERFPEMTWRERAFMAPLLLLIVLLGVFPKPILDRVEPSVDRLIRHVEDHSDYQQPSVAAGAQGR
jgi:NADH-quinone oxidoreductase subunit M